MSPCTSLCTDLSVLKTRGERECVEVTCLCQRTAFALPSNSANASAWIGLKGAWGGASSTFPLGDHPTLLISIIWKLK